MRVDLHNHTSRYSQCSLIDPYKLIDRYIERNIDGLCITEHNAVWPEDGREYLRKKYADRIRLFFGYEIDTDAGHVLVFSRKTAEFPYETKIPLRQLAKIFPRESSAFIWAHPYRWKDFHESDRELFGMFDAVELYNGNMSEERIRYTYEKLRQYVPVFTGGSDTHSHEMCAKYATLFACQVRTEDELISAVKQGLCRPEVL